jgi:hypothetical protein
MESRIARSSHPARRRSPWMALIVVALIAVFLALWTDDLFQRCTLFRPD